MIQTHQCMSAVLKYAIRTDRLAKNVANGIESAQDGFRSSLPNPSAVTPVFRVLHGHGPDETAADFQTLTLATGYCGLRFGEAIALRRVTLGTASSPSGPRSPKLTAEARRGHHEDAPHPLGTSARNPLGATEGGDVGTMGRRFAGTDPVGGQPRAARIPRPGRRIPE